jgi:hypothetical protein
MLEFMSLDSELNNRIADLILNAEANPFTMEVMKHAMENRLPIIPKGCRDFEIELPLDHRVVYTVEEHPIGICKHISISQNNDSPSFDNLLTIISYFGFVTNLQDKKAHAYVENCLVNGEECKAINVIELLF